MNAIEKQVILNIFELLREKGLLTLEETNQLKFKIVNKGLIRCPLPRQK